MLIIVKKRLIPLHTLNDLQDFSKTSLNTLILYWSISQDAGFVSLYFEHF